MKINIMALCCIPLCALISCATLERDVQTPQLANDSDIFWPPAPQKKRVRFIQSISNSGDIGLKKTWLSKALDSLLGREESEGAMLRPYGVAASANKIYVTDPGLSLIHIFDLEKRKYRTIDSAGGKELVSPLGISVDVNGEVFVTDSILKRVFIFDTSGAFLGEIGSDEIFSRPTGIAVDENRVYVVDTLRHQVLVFSKKDGTLLLRIGQNGTKNGDFNYPTHIFLSRDKQIYVTDSLNFRIQIFDVNGKFLFSFGRLGDALGDFSKPKGIAVDSENHIYVVDSQFDNMQIFDKAGKLLLVVGSTGRGPGKMSIPSGIFIDNQDRIYVADSYNKRIQIFQYLKE
jgi:DNA-binding beta-propeller fold protein YncE